MKPVNLKFDPHGHRYSVDGFYVPSVTELLAPLQPTRFIDGEILRASAHFGTAVHRACELHDRGELDPVSVHPAVAKYLEAWQQFERDHEVRWSAVEERVYHPVLRYAGTLDRCGVVDGLRSVVEIKTGTSLWPSVGPQLAAYAQARASPSDSLAADNCRRLAVLLKPTGGYVLREYTSSADWAVFASLLTLRSFCAQHRLTPSFSTGVHHGASSQRTGRV